VRSSARETTRPALSKSDLKRASSIDDNATQAVPRRTKPSSSTVTGGRAASRRSRASRRWANSTGSRGNRTQSSMGPSSSGGSASAATSSRRRVVDGPTDRRSSSSGHQTMRTSSAAPFAPSTGGCIHPPYVGKPCSQPPPCSRVPSALHVTDFAIVRRPACSDRPAGTSCGPSPPPGRSAAMPGARAARPHDQPRRGAPRRSRSRRRRAPPLGRRPRTIEPRRRRTVGACNLRWLGSRPRDDQGHTQVRRHSTRRNPAIARAQNRRPSTTDEGQSHDRRCHDGHADR